MADGTGNPQSYVTAGDPTRTPESAQWWLLYAVLVANKPADITTRKLTEFLTNHATPFDTPFETLRNMVKAGIVRLTLMQVRTGQYRRIEAAMLSIDSHAEHNPDPRTWSLETLETIPGIGPKTARWFYMLIRPDAKVAALDTHVLKFLGDQGEKVPKGTPPAGIAYHVLEAKFLKWAEKLGIKPRDLDFMVWTIYRNKGKIKF